MGGSAEGTAPFAMVNIKGLGVYVVMIPITSVVEPIAGGWSKGFSSTTCMSAVLVR